MSLISIPKFLSNSFALAVADIESSVNHIETAVAIIARLI